ncbi:hypothetical protein NDU88_006615 [Pleurodeles waltl]|uniref:Uncharacterized protein n=1 Tax=Pleurodeles waltl TaxID=8319 RepID=A0AAV7WGV4_PLEWA|nr:hypothetical protein NDU88_006615 [Pleurodeles waltl]
MITRQCANANLHRDMITTKEVLKDITGGSLLTTDLDASFISQSCRQPSAAAAKGRARCQLEPRQARPGLPLLMNSALGPAHFRSRPLLCFRRRGAAAGEASGPVEGAPPFLGPAQALQPSWVRFRRSTGPGSGSDSPPFPGSGSGAPPGLCLVLYCYVTCV